MTARRQALELRGKQNGEEADAIRTEGDELTLEQKRLVEHGPQQ